MIVFAILPIMLAAAESDTLLYNLSLIAGGSHVSVEARLTRTAPGPVALASPPMAGPAGTRVAGFAATDDRGRALEVRRAGRSWVVMSTGGPVRFRYRLEFQRRVSESSTGSGLDSSRLYGITRGMFVAPDPVAFRKTGESYPELFVSIIAPPGWQVIAGWPQQAGVYRPANGDELLGSTIAAAADFRIDSGRVGSTSWRLALRGRRYFTDSLLREIVVASLERSAAALGSVPVPMVSYTADLGRKGRTSGSLQGTASIGLVWEPSEILETARGHDVFHETVHLWFGGAIEAPRWWTEGVTDYFAARLWAEWRGEPADLAELCFTSLRNYQAIEHRTRLTMAQETRQGIGGDNTELLVYRKGMLAGLLLDAAIRRGGSGRSLDDVARRLIARARLRASRTVRDEDIRAEVLAAGGRPAAEMWDRIVAGTAVIVEEDVRQALEIVTGRRIEPPTRLAKAPKELMR